MNPGIDPHFLTKSGSDINSLLQDKVKISFISARMMETFLDISSILNNNSNNEFDCPVLFLIGKKDNLCVPEFVISYYKNLDNENKELVMLENGKHEPMMDAEQDEIIEIIKTWSKKNQNLNFEMPEKFNKNYSSYNWKKFMKIVIIILFIVFLKNNKIIIKKLILRFIKKLKN